MQKIVIGSLATCVLFLLVLTGLQRNTIQSLSRSVEEYRLDFEQSRRANERYADAYREATETNTELGKCLSEHVSTLSQLREQLQAVRSRYEKMQTILADLANSGDLVVGGNDSDDSGSINRGDCK